MKSDASGRIRLDKWLWAARFFKTRALATEAVSGGKVHVNDLRAKPARAVNVGDRMTVQRGPYEMEIVVCELSSQRGPAKQAVLLYEETPQSIAKRTTLAEQRRMQAAAAPQPLRRPNKKERRKIVRFTRQQDSSS